MCIEVKGTSTKDLFSNQNRDKPEHQTPIHQTWDYMGSGDFDYGIATNYRDFVLIDKKKGYSRYHLFDFMSVQGNLLKLKEFVAIFSRNSLLNTGFVSQLYEESVVEEREFTKEFYKLYHETRLMLIKEFQDNEKIAKKDAIHYAQVFLNRLIFIFFAEDTGKIRKRLFSESILQSLNPKLVSEHSRYACNTILNLFESLDKGAHQPIEIFGFNGGLFRDKIPENIFFKDLRTNSFFKEVFQYSLLKDNIRLDEFAQEVVDKFKNNLNPITKNLLIMSSFDFQSDLNVNILGHIFEQSLTDLEELQGLNTVSKRKTEGIYYTPQYITEYICKSTIIPQLSKTGNSITIEQLMDEYSDDVETLEKRFRSIRIVDPACGSGAFLIQAVTLLLEIHKQIRILKEVKGKYAVIKKGRRRTSDAEIMTLSKWNEEEEARTIIENNIFGVDVNEESIEITKLSLFLKIASTNRKLIDLSKNIKVGNSLVDDSQIISNKAFVWQQEFKSIFENGGFDVVIGNPPYLRIQGLHEGHENITKFVEQKYAAATGRYDFYVLFIERGIGLLKKDGYLGFIVPHKFTNSLFGRGIRKIISEKRLMNSFLNFGHHFVFEGVTTYTGILVLQNRNNQKLRYREIGQLRSSSLENEVLSLTQDDFMEIDLGTLGEDPWILKSGLDSKVLNKIGNAGPSMLDYFDKILQGIITGDDELYFLSPVKDKGSTMIMYSEKTKSNVELEKAILEPILLGEDVKRYRSYDYADHYLIYPYTIDGEEQRPLSEDELKQEYPLAYSYLDNFKDHLVKLKKKFKTNPVFWYGLHRARRKEWFNMERIITPQITYGCNMTLDRNKMLHNAKVYSLLKKNDVPEDNRYFLAIVNSRLMWFFLKSTGYVLRGGYFTFTTEYLKPFCIPKPPSKAAENDICRDIDSLLGLYKEFDHKSATFQNRVKVTFGLPHVPKSIERFYELSLESFLAELKKLSANMISLKELDEWEEYFRSYQTSALRLRSEIISIESKLDNQVFDLYGLDARERQYIIESTALLQTR